MGTKPEHRNGVADAIPASADAHERHSDEVGSAPQRAGTLAARLR